MPYNELIEHIFSKKVALVCGGSAGHVYPAIALSQIYKCDLFIEKKCEKLISVSNKIEYKTFEYGSKYNFFSLIKSFFLFLYKLSNYDYVIFFGSYVCLPGFMAAVLCKFKKLKIILHEQNYLIGNANEKFLKFSNLLLTTYCGTKSKIPTYCLGYPIFAIKNKIEELDVIFVMTGTHCSVFLDEYICEILIEFVKNEGKKYKIYYQAHPKNIEKIKNSFKMNNIMSEVSNFFFNYEKILAMSRIVIIRGGMGSIANCKFYEKTPIIIPLKDSVNNHQLINAEKSGYPYVEEKNIMFLASLLKINKNHFFSNSFKIFTEKKE